MMSSTGSGDGARQGRLTFGEGLRRPPAVRRAQNMGDKEFPWVAQNVLVRCKDWVE